MLNNILMINLHTHNFGDEALGKALVNKLLNEKKYNNLNILYTHNNDIDDKGFIEFDNPTIINQHEALKSSLFQKVTIRVLLWLPFSLSYFLTKVSLYKKEAGLIDASKFIISAPGGVNIGPYQDWTYLWRIYYALKTGKKVAVYSISFGPLPDNKLFKKRSEYILKNVDFLALRDQKSQQLARDMGLDFIPSIDTTFLDNKNYKYLLDKINLEKNYVVITPNELCRWHKKYKIFSENRIMNVYVSIIDKLVDLDLNVVILPHLFGYKYDDIYTEHIIDNLNSTKNVISFRSDEITSDIVQAIISQANFVIGSRFHTIMFAIKHKIPFYALSYEHKIMNTLTELSLEELALDFYEELYKNNDQYIVESVIKTYKSKELYLETIDQKSDLAASIALDVYQKFLKVM